MKNTILTKHYNNTESSQFGNWVREHNTTQYNGEKDPERHNDGKYDSAKMLNRVEDVQLSNRWEYTEQNHM